MNIINNNLAHHAENDAYFQMLIKGIFLLNTSNNKRSPS